MDYLRSKVFKNHYLYDAILMSLVVDTNIINHNEFSDYLEILNPSLDRIISAIRIAKDIITVDKLTKYATKPNIGHYSNLALAGAIQTSTSQTNQLLNNKDDAAHHSTLTSLANPKLNQIKQQSIVQIQQTLNRSYDQVAACINFINKEKIIGNITANTTLEYLQIVLTKFGLSYKNHFFYELEFKSFTMLLIESGFTKALQEYIDYLEHENLTKLMQDTSMHCIINFISNTSKYISNHSLLTIIIKIYNSLLQRNTSDSIKNSYKDTLADIISNACHKLDPIALEIIIQNVTAIKLSELSFTINPHDIIAECLSRHCQPNMELAKYNNKYLNKIMENTKFEFNHLSALEKEQVQADAEDKFLIVYNLINKHLPNLNTDFSTTTTNTSPHDMALANKNLRFSKFIFKLYPKIHPSKFRNLMLQQNHNLLLYFLENYKDFKFIEQNINTITKMPKHDYSPIWDALIMSLENSEDTKSRYLDLDLDTERKRDIPSPLLLLNAMCNIPSLDKISLSLNNKNILFYLVFLLIPEKTIELTHKHICDELKKLKQSKNQQLYQTKYEEHANSVYETLSLIKEYSKSQQDFVAENTDQNPDELTMYINKINYMQNIEKILAQDDILLGQKNELLPEQSKSKQAKNRMR